MWSCPTSWKPSWCASRRGPRASAWRSPKARSWTTTLERLSQRGYKLSIDDFGTGYSSLAYLQQLPVQELKIDMSFVKGMEKNPGDETIVRSTIELAHNLGLSVVAEGVENAAILQRLGELGCDEAQGYHLSKPVPLVQLQAWAAQRGLPVQAAAASATGAPALH